jgi:hypothetical protein
MGDDKRLVSSVTTNVCKGSTIVVSSVPVDSCPDISNSSKQEDTLGEDRLEIAGDKAGGTESSSISGEPMFWVEKRCDLMAEVR